jgi:hypothetical protein
MSSTTADFSFLMDDATYQAMRSGEVAWGDICMDPVPFVPDPADIPAAEPRAQQLEYGWDFEYPLLRLRKDIWENFPVTVTPLGRGADGAERHAIAWHRAKLAEWRETKPACFCDWMDYEMDTEHRLFTSLEASTYWTVEEATADGQICVIRMNFAPREEVTTTIVEAAAAEEADSDEDAFIAVFAKKAPAVVAAAPTSGKAAATSGTSGKAPAAPLFTRLNDIKEYFPVVWHKVEEARTRTAVYALEIFGKKLTEMARAAGKPAGAYRADVERRLDAALRASPAWRVLRSEGREFCRLEMA